MKRLILITICVFFAIFHLQSQIPNQFKYQAIVRNGGGEILNKQVVSLKISILQNSASGAIVYSEVFDLATNEFGIISVNIGSGAVISGTFSSIAWGTSTYYLQVEIDIQGGNNYAFMGASQILAVPYALYALDVKNNNDADADPSNEIQDLQLVDNVLTVTRNANATKIPLSQYIGTDTDQQTLSTNTIGSTVQISILRGNTVNIDLPSDFVSKSSGGTFGGPIHATNLSGIGNLNLLQDFSISGAGSVLLYSQGNTNITLPLSGTLASESFVDQRISLNAISATHPASGITSLNITNWNTAYSWGNHNGLYRSISYVPAWTEITGKPNLALVATSGSFADLINKPTTVSGYGITDAFNGTWASLTGKPTLANIATTGSFGDLLNKPTTISGYGITDAFSGTWASLTGKPTTISGYGIIDAFDGTWASLANKPTFAAVATSGSFTDLISKPTTISGYGITDAFNGTWVNLTGKPTTISGYGITDAFNGTWANLTGKPTTISGYGITDAFDGTWINLSGKPTFATVAISGSFTDLSNKPTTISGYGITDAFNGAWSGITGKPTTIAGYGITDAFNGTWASLSGKPTFAAVATSGSYTDLLSKPSFATVATSGSYTDLTNKPTYATIATTGNFADLSGKPTTLSGYGISDALPSNFTGNSNIVTLGTIGNGVWNGSQIEAGYINWTKPGIIGSTTPNSASFTDISISDVLKLIPRTQPLSGTLGNIYVDSTDSHIYFYNGSGWVRLD